MHPNFCSFGCYLTSYQLSINQSINQKKFILHQNQHKVVQRCKQFHGINYSTLVQTDIKRFKQFLKDINSLSILNVIWESVPFFGTKVWSWTISKWHTASSGYNKNEMKTRMIWAICLLDVAEISLRCKMLIACGEHCKQEEVLWTWYRSTKILYIKDLGYCYSVTFVVILQKKKKLSIPPPRGKVSRQSHWVGGW